MIDHHQFDYLFKHVPVKPGDFFYVPAGTVHAIGSESSFWKLNNLQIQHIVYTIMTEKIKWSYA